jgi:transmembrane sensor
VHDSSHPFIVRAGNGQTRVTGTQFNVWKYEDQVKVTLVEGSVLVSNDGNAGGYRLGPGMQASYHTGDFEPQLSQSDDSGNSLAWRSGKLVLDNLSLEQALPVINRYLDARCAWPTAPAHPHQRHLQHPRRWRAWSTTCPRCCRST